MCTDRRASIKGGGNVFVVVSEAKNCVPLLRRSKNCIWFLIEAVHTVDVLNYMT